MGTVSLHANRFVGLAGRLRIAVTQAGGITAVVQAVGISRAQLSRYLQGAPIPSDRLMELAPALGVTAAWLLGEENSTREGFIDALGRMRVYGERLLRLLQRYEVERALLPAEIARVLELAVLSQQNAMEMMGKVEEYSDYDLENGLNFLNNIRRNDWLDVYAEGCKYVMENGLHSLEGVWPGKWVGIVQEAFKLHFTREPLITDYYVRLNTPIWDRHLAMMQYWVETVIRGLADRRKIRVLDAGCGNGRHSIFLHKMGDRFQLQGIDASPAALAFCRTHEKTGALPAGFVREGDFLDLPYESGSFEAYISIANLQFIPLVPGSVDVGVGRALSEAARVLVAGGYALLLVRSENPDEYFPVFQVSHPVAEMELLLKKTGFKLVERKPMRLREVGKPGSRFGRSLSKQDFWIVQKS